jgi:hypothetical protein
MTWQDGWFAFAGLFYTVAMIPSMMDTRCRMPLATSVPTAVLLTVSCGTYLTLDFAASAFACFIGAISWTFMAVCRR